MLDRLRGRLSRPEPTAPGVDARLEWNPIRDVPAAFADAVAVGQRALAAYLDQGDLPRAEAVGEAWDAIIARPDFAAAPVAFRADVLNRSAIAGNWRAVRGEDLTALDASLARLDEAMRLSPDLEPHCLCNITAARTVRFQLGGDPADLAGALETGERAMERAAGDRRLWPLAASETANALSVRFRGSGQRADLDRAVALADESVRVAAGEGSPRLTRYRQRLFTLLVFRFDAYAALDDLDRSIAVAEAQLAAAGPAERDAASAELGSLLRRRWGVLEHPADLERAVELLAVAYAAGTGGPARWTNYGNAMLDRYHVRGDAADLAAAVEAHERAVENTTGGDWQLASRCNNAGNSRLAVFARTADQAELDRAVAHYRRAIRLTPATSPELASRLYNLGNALAARGPAADADAVRDAYREACSTGLEAGVQWALAASQAWGRFARARGDWPQAAEALTPGLEAIDALFRRQLTRDEKETWLAHAAGLPRDAGYALARCGRAEAAAAVLERGRAYLLSEALERDRADLAVLESEGRGELAARYREASDELRRATDADRTRAARTAVDEVIEAIRAVPGHERFAHAPDFGDVAAAAVASPVVYLAATGAGGVAIVVAADVAPVVVALDALTEDAVAVRARALWQAHERRATAPGAWAGTLDAVTAWLWPAAMAPVLEALGGTREATVVAGGLLGVLPLHAAWTADAARPGGRRHAIDSVALSYVPNARSATAAGEVAARVTPVTLLAVEDPWPTSAGGVPGAEVEVAAVREGFTGATTCRREQATRANVLALLGARDVLHLACHGVAFAASPLDSALILAGDEPLRLRDVLGARLADGASGGARLAVLSACEGGRPGDALPDEVIALPAGLLEAGVAGVVASQWAVDGAATAMLMTRFYAGWRGGERSPATALRDAQRWLRDATNGEKAAWFAERAAAARDPRAAAALRTLWRACARRPAAGHDHSEARYWAAFAHFGV